MADAPILAILNPAAGRRRHDGFAAVIAGLRASGAEVALCVTRGPGDAERHAGRAASLGCTMVLAAGGDGTVNEVLNGLVETPLPLAVYPLGTTNVLAREIGASADPGRFLRLLRTRPPQPAWLGEISGRRFALMASVGFDASVVDKVNAALKRRIGKGAYLAAAARQLLRHSPGAYCVTIDGKVHRAAAAIVAKGRYYAGSFTVAPLARVTEPGFQVCLLGGGTRKDVLRYAAALACGRLSRLPDVQIIGGREIEITGVEGEPVQCDGDIVARLPAIARLAPSPVRLLMQEPL